MALDFPSNPTDGQVYNNYYWSAATSAWRSVNSVYAPNYLKNATLGTTSVTGVPLTVQGYASQSANLQEWKNSSGTTLMNVDSAGFLNAISGANFTLGPGALNLKAAQNDHTYMQFFARTAAQSTRSGFLGYGSAGSNDLSMTNEISGGNIILNPGTNGQVTLPTKTYMPGAIVQVQEYRPASGDKTVASGATTDILNVTFTTKIAGSKIFMTYYTGQVNHGSPQANMLLTYLIDGVDQGLATHHIFYSDASGTTFRPAATVPLMSTSTYTAGAHTLIVRGGAYNSSITYDFQSTGSPERRSRLIVMEVAQ